MARVSIYLNFRRETEEAFLFYKEVFGGEFEDGMHRMGEVPPQEGVPELSDEEKNLVMHVALPILDGFMLMGTDVPESLGATLTPGNTVYINLEPDTRAETERLFNCLSEGGEIYMPLLEMFWGDYYGSLRDKFGIHWMCNCSEKAIQGA